jgi:SAM-dependent methyltransferase
LIHWREDEQDFAASWRSLSGAPPPARVVVADGRMTADEAYGLACQGTALLWRGDFHEARQLLNALGRRADRRASRSRNAGAANDSAAAFNRYRQQRSQRARTLNALLIPFDEHYVIPLRRAPEVRAACTEAFGAVTTPSVMPLRALQGAIGAHEWRVKGIDIPEAGGRIHPHFGVFAPIRREYVDLVSTAPLPAACASHSVAFDVGTGTGVLAAVLARRGVERVVATDLDGRALECARENIARLGLGDRVQVVQADLFPEGRAALAVCNPPWIPARPSSSLEHGIYDPDGQMLRGFLAKLPGHLVPGGEGWLILSDLAERLGLRTRAQLLDAFETAGLRVLDRHDIAPRHPRAADASDLLHHARAAEITSLWRLAAR